MISFKVGQQVVKKSNKPFKSKNKIATISGFVINKTDPKQRIAANFKEDDSMVNLDKLKGYGS